MKRIGFLLNPIAGMGGKVGLKGTDGKVILQQAQLLGAEPESRLKAQRALKKVKQLATADYEIITPPGTMGANCCRELSLPVFELDVTTAQPSTSADTIQVARLLVELGVDLLVFAGGDGTARDITKAIDQRVPVIGIPAGVKIHSGVYATKPETAGEMIAEFINRTNQEFELAEVMDIDEELFRQNTVQAKLYGYLLVPKAAQFQKTKAGGVTDSQQSLYLVAEMIISQMSDDTVYLIGPGSSTVPVMDCLNLPASLLGVDILRNKQLLVSDASESQILENLVPNNTKVVLSVIGGQGYLIGRGNQQLSAKVLSNIQSDDLIIIATLEKIIALEGRPLLIDTGSSQVDEQLRGYHKVLIDYDKYLLYRCE